MGGIVGRELIQHIDLYNILILSLKLPYQPASLLTDNFYDQRPRVSRS